MVYPQLDFAASALVPASPMANLWRRALSRAETVLHTWMQRLERSEELRLVRQSQAGNKQAEDAFRRLIKPHEAWLAHYLLCLLGSQADAEEIAQEALLRAFLALGRFRGDASFRTWLRRIASNQAFNSRRRRRPKPTGDGEFVVTDERPSAERVLQSKQALLAVLSRLSYPYREALVLQHVEELSVQEVAAHLGIGESAAKMRLKRARAKFLDVYDELHALPEDHNAR